EHAAELLQTTFTEGLVSAEDHLGVRLRLEDEPGRFQHGAERAIVVELTVVDEPDGVVVVGHRLLPAGDVDDRQAAEAEADAVRGEQSFVVGTTMNHRVLHAPEDVHVHGPGRPKPHHPTDAAHGYPFLPLMPM